MDSARLGRALGAGTRQLAKTAVEVSRAINTPGPDHPDGASTSGPAAGHHQQTPADGNTRQPRAATATTTAARSAQLTETARRSRGVLKPLKKFTGTVWLQVTGTFFLLFALSLGTAAWKTRASRLAAGTPQQRHFWLYVAFAVLFGYFALSSFIRAEKR